MQCPLPPAQDVKYLHAVLIGDAYTLINIHIIRSVNFGQFVGIHYVNIAIYIFYNFGHFCGANECM